MKISSVVLAAGGIAASSFMLMSVGAHAMPLPPMQALSTAAAELSPVAPVRCFKREFYGSCDVVCERLASDLPGYSYFWNETDCDNANQGSAINRETCRTNSRNTVMKKVRSCRISPGT